MPASAEQVVAAAGGVVWRTAEDGGLEVVVVHRSRYDDWSLPKGKLDAGEDLLTAAVREVGEETGLVVLLGRRLLRTSYPLAPGTKRVDYWLMRAVGGAFEPNDEVDELRWLPAAAARELVTQDHDRAVLDDAARDDVPREPSLLLVRHARAGKRGNWDGPDETRPLDARGRAQADRLAQVLPLFGPSAVLSAERTRCRQTVEPLAARLGLDVLPAPALGEEEFAADPQAGMALVEQLLAARDRPGVTVVCSQGGAIPSVLSALGVGGQSADGWPPSAKGSVWAVGGRPGALGADYYRDLDPDPDAPR